jgi:hypothetical protein
MSESRSTAVAIQAGSARNWLSGIQRSAGLVGSWAVDTAQQFGAVVSALMGPAVLSVYSFTAWSLADNLGWTDTFICRTGAFSNWLVWLAIALLVNSASIILRRQYPRVNATD